MKGIVCVGGGTCAAGLGELDGVGRSGARRRRSVGVEVGDCGGLRGEEHELCSVERGDGGRVGELAAFAEELLVRGRDVQRGLEGLFEVEDRGGRGHRHHNRFAGEADLDGDRRPVRGSCRLLLF